MYILGQKSGLMCIVILAIFILSACSPGEPAPNRPFTTEALLLTAEDVPSHWYLARIAPLGPSIGFGDEEDDREAMFTHPDDEAQLVFSSHMVLRFESSREAERWYKRNFPSWFNDNSIAVDEPWQTPPELSYRSSVADQFRVACTINNIAGPTQVCKMMAQYEEYVTIFRSTIEADTLTLPEFDGLVRRIDEIMIEHLQGS